jgi:uncharacterized membrane protein
MKLIPVPVTPPSGDGDDGYVLSYFALRRIVGYMGIALPVIVFFVGLVWPPHEFLGSISAYYYVPFAGDIFIGLLWVIGVFLWFYDYRKPDNVLTSLAGTFAICIVLFPTTKNDSPASLMSVATIHKTSAALFFVILAVLSMRYFTRGDTKHNSRKKARNRVYLITGWVMIGALLIAGLGPFVLGREGYVDHHVLFCCEAAASWAFGISWLVKGQRLLADLGNT